MPRLFIALTPAFPVGRIGQDMSRLRRLSSLAVVTALLLAGCSGGSDGGGDTGGGATTPNAFAVSTSATGSGTGNISPSSVNITQGSTTTFNIAPDSSSVVSSVTGCGGSLAGATFTTGAINADCTVTADFTLKNYSVSATAEEGGSISPGATTVDHGGTFSFAVTPAAGFGIDAVTGCSGTLNGTTYTTGAITSSCTVTASFAADRFTVTASAGEGGSITPDSTTVEEGQTASFALVPDDGFLVDTVIGCDGNLDADTYTTAPITTHCQVAASFVAAPVNFLGQLQGIYEGQMKSPKNSFFLDSTTLTIEIDGDTADITKEAFFGRTCLFNGTLAGESYPINGDGTFQCSDFSEGSWTAPTIAKMDATTILATFSLDDGVAPYQIKFGGFGFTAPSLYSPDDDYWLRDAPLSDFSGSYDGQMKSTDSCAALTFGSTSAELSIQVNADTVEITRDSFYDGICELSGTNDSFIDGVLQASGTFRCSNFDEGTWASERISMVDSDVLFATLKIDVPARGCSYTVRHIVFKLP